MMPTQQRRPRNPEAATRSSAATASVGDPTHISALARAEVARILSRIEWAGPVRRREFEEALGDALAHTWRRRADLLEWARPRPGDYPGRATAAELSARDERLAAQAAACRAKATLLERGLLDDPDMLASLDDVLAEEAEHDCL